MSGRPRGLDIDISKLPFGIVTAEATFVCLDSVITYV
jgi:hypothetical protein